MSHKSRTAEAILRLSPTLGAKDKAVLAASRITALMEQAAARLVQQGRDSSDSSVAIAMNVIHAGPALASGDFRGATVRAVASYRGVAGRLHYVAIDAFDESGLIASAEQTRAIVSGRPAPALTRRRGATRAELHDV